MANVSDKPWGGFSAADYKDAAAYCDACLIDDNPAGADKVKGMCHLPVKEPSGAVNRNGVHAAWARLAGAGGGTSLSPADKKAAARKLASLYRNDLKETPPPPMLRMAGQ